MSHRPTVVDPLKICPHIEVTRTIDEANPRYYSREWRCKDCGETFDFLGNIGEPGKIVVTEPCSTLRDQFAMAALNGLVASDSKSFGTLKEVAASVFRLADEMMKTRTK